MKTKKKAPSVQQVEQLMKESLALSVHIDSKFKDELWSEVHQRTVNKFLVEGKMDKSKIQIRRDEGVVSAVKQLFTQKRFLMVVTTLVAVTVVAATLLITGVASLPSGSSRLSGNQIATMYINSGSATVLREGQELVQTEEYTLEIGDVVQTSADGMIDIKMAYGRLALDSNTKATFAGQVDDVDVKLENGTVFVSTATDYNEQVVIDTLTGAQVLIENGSALIMQTGLESMVMSQSLINKAWAVTEGQTEEVTTKVIAVAGKVEVKQDSAGIIVEIGKEVTVKAQTMEEVKECDRNAFQTQFFEGVKKKEQEEGKDLGTATDLTAPTVTIISPENGVEVDKNSVTVKFKSNEDGWLINESPWQEIMANEEVTYEVTNLKEGKNVVELKVKDKSYNRTVETLEVNYTAPEPAIGIVWDKLEGRSNGVYLEWTAKGVTKGVHKYKVFRNGVYKVSIDIIDTNVSWTDTNTSKGTTYKYKVAVYKDGDKVVITEEKSIKAQTESSGDSSSCSVNLWRTTSAELLNKSLFFKSHAIHTSNDVAWSVSGDCPDYNGYKLVWNDTGSPAYPDNKDGYQYISAGTKEGNVANGTWYVRVGLYKDGVCSVYSNQLHGTFE